MPLAAPQGVPGQLSRMAGTKPSIRWGQYWIFSLRLTMRTRPCKVGSGEIGHGLLEQRPDAPPGQLGGIRRGLEERQPGPGSDQLAHRPADVGVQVIPRQDDGTVQLLARGVQEPGVVRLSEALAPIVQASAQVRAVDQPGPSARAGRRSARPATPACRGRRSPSPPGCGRGVLRCVLSAASGPERTRPGSRARRQGPPPSFMAGQVSSRHLAIWSSSRSAARRAGICMLRPIRYSSTSILASVYSTPNRCHTYSEIRASVQH